MGKNVTIDAEKSLAILALVSSALANSRCISCFDWFWYFLRTSLPLGAGCCAAQCYSSTASITRPSVPRLLCWVMVEVVIACDGGLLDWEVG